MVAAGLGNLHLFKTDFLQNLTVTVSSLYALVSDDEFTIYLNGYRKWPFRGSTGSAI